MASPLSHLRNRTPTTDEQARVLAIDDADADAVLDALAADTRRRTFRSLFEEPRTTTELADDLDTSVQNAQYHLSTLEDAGLVEPIDTVYSEKGNEMTVYGPATDPLVFVGDDDRRPRVRRSLAEVVGGLALLGAASLFVQTGAELLRGTDRSVGVGPTGLVPSDPASFDALSWFVFETVEPGVLFFVGGLLVAALVAGVARR
jgi:DNA-binding transcriptional ArsR family regulator